MVVRHSQLHKNRFRRFDIVSAPLVSILIPNYNHSRYLDECITSALRQTWPNKEIIVLDNQSTDDSVRVAGKYVKDGVRVCRNIINIRNLTYRVLSDYLSTGTYFILLGADDALEPTFIEKAVRIMEAYPNVGYVHGERDFIREDGSRIVLDPFFRCSFVCPGEDIMPLYMVTTIAHPAQGVIRRAAFDACGGYEMEIDHMNADRMLWFYLSSVSDYAYIREKMSRIRVSGGTETILTQRNFQHPLLCHLTVKAMLRFARQKNYPKVLARERDALNRLAQEFIGYAGGQILHDNFKNGLRYLRYAEVIERKIVEDSRWQKLEEMCRQLERDEAYLRSIDTAHLARKRGYNPPDNFAEIGVEALNG